MREFMTHFGNMASVIVSAMKLSFTNVMPSSVENKKYTCLITNRLLTSARLFVVFSFYYYGSLYIESYPERVVYRCSSYTPTRTAKAAQDRLYQICRRPLQRYVLYHRSRWVRWLHLTITIFFLLKFQLSSSIFP